MDNLKQRTEIGKHTGWHFKKALNCDTVGCFNPEGNRVGDWQISKEFAVEYLPDYLNDWNAMRDAVNSLGKRIGGFVAHLDVITKAKGGCLAIRIIEATLAEYAEAFLRTVGKWEES